MLMFLLVHVEGNTTPSETTTLPSEKRQGKARLQRSIGCDEISQHTEEAKQVWTAVAERTIFGAPATQAAPQGRHDLDVTPLKKHTAAVVAAGKR